MIQKMNMRKQRSKFREVERIYFCNYKGCNKGYGRLNHLNDHVRIQKHGEIRKPSEFALLRKELKKRRLQEEINRGANDQDLNAIRLLEQSNTREASPQQSTTIDSKATRLPPLSMQLPLSPPAPISTSNTTPVAHGQHNSTQAPAPSSAPSSAIPPPAFSTPHHLQLPPLSYATSVAAHSTVPLQVSQQQRQLPTPPLILPPLQPQQYFPYHPHYQPVIQHPINSNNHHPDMNNFNASNLPRPAI